MSEHPVFFYPTLESVNSGRSEQAPDQSSPDLGSGEQPRIETGTCTEAETFVLRVLDDSMEPEFRSGCMIVIDPTGRATDGSFVLARRLPTSDQSSTAGNSVEDYVFRRLCKSGDGNWALQALNPEYSDQLEKVALSEIVGVIVQRAGTRRRYHKRYD